MSNQVYSIREPPRKYYDLPGVQTWRLAANQVCAVGTVQEIQYATAEVVEGDPTIFKEVAGSLVPQYDGIYSFKFIFQMNSSNMGTYDFEMLAKLNFVSVFSTAFPVDSLQIFVPKQAVQPTYVFSLSWVGYMNAGDQVYLTIANQGVTASLNVLVADSRLIATKLY